MTQAPSIKEALEPFASAADNYSDCTDDGKFIDDDATVTVANLRDARAALATLQPCGERREAIARAIAAYNEVWNGWPELEAKNVDECREEAMKAALIASGLVQDEAAIANNWHTTGWDRARNSGRILLVWREFAGVREHVELGRYSDSKSAWVNTYGHPFHADPDGWAPLLPFKNETAIRADEREKLLGVVTDDRTGYSDYLGRLNGIEPPI